MTALVLYDDERARLFEPFALTRPTAELRAGALLLRERWERALGARASATVAAPHLADFAEFDAPGVMTGGTLAAGTIVANSRFAVALAPADADADVWRSGDRVAAVRLARDVPVADLADGGLALDALVGPGSRERSVGGRWMDEVWELVAAVGAQLSEDLPLLAGAFPAASLPATVQVTGGHRVTLEPGASVEPFVVLDASAGPIHLAAGATVQSFTRLAGPCYVGRASAVLGGPVSGCAIGDVCRVRGEISATVVLGHANKGHDGFVGHSYLGRWVNLGAGTTTSNLKNTYGTVALWTPAGVRDTRLQFLGSLLGDHAKTGIGTRLTTGSVIGAGANVYGSAMPPKYVEPFAWGDGAPYGAYELEKFLAVAERAMARRQVALGDGGRRQLATAYRRARPGAGAVRA